MNNTYRHPLLLLGLATLCLTVSVGCHEEEVQKDDKTPPAKSDAKKVEVGKNVYLEIDGDKRRVLVNTVVCRRVDQLEQFLCKKMTKEHESILSADVDAEKIHTALILAGAEAGSPVKFQPKYTPAHGTTIKVYVQWEEKGKTMKVPAQQWIRSVKTQKQMAHDWVFAGSQFLPNFNDPKGKPYYAANYGDLICVSNFDDAMMDLPVASSDKAESLDFEAFTERIPPLETPVLLILEPVLPAKKK